METTPDGAVFQAASDVVIHDRKNKGGARYVDITFNQDGMEVTLERKNYRTVLGGKVFCPTQKQQLKMEEIPRELPMSMKG